MSAKRLTLLLIVVLLAATPAVQARIKLVALPERAARP